MMQQQNASTKNFQNKESSGSHRKSAIKITDEDDLPAIPSDHDEAMIDGDENPSSFSKQIPDYLKTLKSNQATQKESDKNAEAFQVFEGDIESLDESQREKLL